MRAKHLMTGWQTTETRPHAMLRGGEQGSLWLLAVLMVLSAAALSTARAASEEGEKRFTVVMDGAAVKDNTTGLVWEQAPDRIFDAWSASVERCKTKRHGGRTDWRAPTIDELKTLIEPSQKDPALPEGHPFSNIKSAAYWSATPSPNDDMVSWQVSFYTGKALTDQKSGNRRMWCVLAT